MNGKRAPSGFPFEKQIGFPKALRIGKSITVSGSGPIAAKRNLIRLSTVRLFIHKVWVAMNSSQTQTMDEQVHVDEFLEGGQGSGKVGRIYYGKKRIVVCAIELNDSGKVKRFYSL